MKAIRCSVALLRTLLLSSGLAACASSDGIVPESHLTDPNALATGHTLETTAGTQAEWPHEQWWRGYLDPQLATLIEQKLGQSPNLRAAQARIRQAKAAAGIARSETLPSAAGAATFMREHFTANEFIPPPYADTSHWDNEAAIKLDYDLDLWGGKRDALNASVDRTKVAAAEAQQVWLDLVGAVVDRYIQLDEAFALRDIERERLAQQQHILDLTNRQVNAGLGTDLDTSQAKTPLPVTRASIERYDEQIALLRDQLAALLGEGPGAGDALTRPQLAAKIEILLPGTLPADLIGHRPDVAASRWGVEAAAKEIDAAKAAFYPNIDLMAFVGFQSLDFDQFLSPSSAIHGLGPAISLPIFEGGKLESNLGGKTAAYDIAVENYNGAVVRSLNQVADQIVRLRSLSVQVAATDQALALAQHAYDLAQKAYDGGLTDYLKVLNAQTLLFQQRQLEVQLRSAQLEAHSALIEALGGGLTVPAAPAQ